LTCPTSGNPSRSRASSPVYISQQDTLVPGIFRDLKNGPNAGSAFSGGAAILILVAPEKEVIQQLDI